MAFRPFRLCGAVLALMLLFPSAPLTARPAPDSFADLAQQLLPTVVNIATTQTLKASGPKVSLPDLPPGSPLEDLFKDFMKNNRSLPQHVTSLGSGFIIDPSGLIVTNNHVIEGADQITVTLNDGTSLPAKLIGRDKQTDLALLSVHPKKPLPAAKFGDSDKARVGDWVMAIGNPFGLGSTVTAGIVSARNRDINAGPYDSFIQTDAPINRGNSGGPLFDMDGEVIGVNSAIFSPSGGSVGIGFSIPSDLVRDVVDQLHKYGATRRGWVGVRIQEVTQDLAQGMGLPTAAGALVANVTPNGPAAKAGLKDGDVIVTYDGKTIGESRSLPLMVAETTVGKTVTIDFIRGGKHQSAKLTVAKLQENQPKTAKAKTGTSAKPPAAKSKVAQLGLSLGTLNSDARAQFKIGGNVQGVVVTDVDPDSDAAQKSLRAGDVIEQVQSQPVRTPADVSRQVDADAKAGKKVVLMLVNRGGDSVYVALRLGGG